MEAMMSAVYNPESEMIARIEQLELEARQLRRSIEHSHGLEDRRVLNRQLQELKDQIEFLRQRVP
jgi:hypothetical protein